MQAVYCSGRTESPSAGVVIVECNSNLLSQLCYSISQLYITPTIYQTSYCTSDQITKLHQSKYKLKVQGRTILHKYQHYLNSSFVPHSAIALHRDTALSQLQIIQDELYSKPKQKCSNASYSHAFNCVFNCAFNCEPRCAHHCVLSVAD